MQVIETGIMRVLIPDKGYKLVNKDTGKQMNKVYLGRLDSIDNYTEIIDEKYVNTDYVVELTDLKEDYNTTKEQNEMTIDIILLTIDELYVMFEPMLAEVPMTMSLFGDRLEQPISKFVLFYSEMVKRDLKDIEDVPERFKEDVKKLI